MEVDSLPIARYRDEILNSVRSFPTTIVVGETGSGKSTQLPQYLLHLGLPSSPGKQEASRDKRRLLKIACTQPRRVATMSVAKRVAEEMQVPLGQEVGYSIRFEDKTSRKTKIKFLTDGVLLRECMTDPDLSEYEVIILDEAHERSLQTDILVGLLRLLQERRPTLRIVVMSATLQVDLYLSYFKVMASSYYFYVSRLQ